MEMLRIYVALILLIVGEAEPVDSDGLKAAADYLLEAIDPAVDPCQDFFRYTCGSWHRKYEGQFISEYEKAEASIRTHLLYLIKSVDEADSSTLAYKKHLKIYLEQCANASTDYDHVLWNIYKETSKLLGSSMPLIDPEGVRKLDPYFVIGRIHRLLKGMGRSYRVSFLQTSVTSGADKCPPKTVLTLAPPPSLMSTSEMSVTGYLMKTNFPERLVKLGSAVGRNLTAVDAQNRVNSLLTYIVNVTEFLEPFKDYPQGFESEYHRVSRLRADVNEHVNWTALLGGLLPDSIYENWIREDPEVLLYSPEYFQHLHSLLGELETADLLDYLYISFLFQYMDDFTDQPYYFTQNHTGWTREHVCLEYVNKYASPAAARMYLESVKYQVDPKITGTVKRDVELLSEAVFAAVGYLVQSAEWLDAEDKARLIDRVKSIDFYSGIPDWVLNDTAVLQHTPHFERNRSKAQNDLRMFDGKVEWLMTSLLTGRLWTESSKAGYYSVAYPDEEDIRFTTFTDFDLNQVQLMFGQLLPPRYNYSYPQVLKFGSLGLEIAYPLFKAFTPSALKEDGEGKWIKRDALQELERLSNCVRQQYNAVCYPEFDWCVVGRHLLWWNIAYMEGIKAAYMAFKFTSQTRAASEVLPGLEHLTADQLFFISVTRRLCFAEANIGQLINSQPQLLAAKAMLELSLMNFPTFGQTFNCRVGTKYAPMASCTLWGDFLEPNIEPVKTNHTYDHYDWD